MLHEPNYDGIHCFLEHKTLLGNLSKFIPVFVFSYYLLDSIHCSLDIEQSERKNVFL